MGEADDSKKGGPGTGRTIGEIGYITYPLSISTRTPSFDEVGHIRHDAS